MADGHLNKCILCTKHDVEERRQKLEATNPAWVLSEKIRHRVKGREKYRTIKASPKKYAAWRKAHREYNKKWHDKYPEKKRAHVILRRAILAGSIKRPFKCSRCKGVGLKIEGHHPDYSKPLDVMWLCRKCHIAQHYEELE